MTELESKVLTKLENVDEIGKSWVNSKDLTKLERVDYIRKCWLN